MQQRLAREVGNEEGAVPALAAECAGPQVARFVAVEYDSHVLHVDHFPARLPTHDLDGVLVAQVVAALDRVVGVVAPVIAPIGQRGVDAALGRVGVASHRVYLADDGHVGAVAVGGQRRTHPRQPCAYDQHIVVEHALLPR